MYTDVHNPICYVTQESHNLCHRDGRYLMFGPTLSDAMHFEKISLKILFLNGIISNDYSLWSTQCLAAYEFQLHIFKQCGTCVLFCSNFEHNNTQLPHCYDILNIPHLSLLYITFYLLWTKLSGYAIHKILSNIPVNILNFHTYWALRHLMKVPRNRTCVGLREQK